MVYIDPKFKTVTYSDINAVSEQYDANISAIWQRNGERFPAMEGSAKTVMEQVFVSTGVIKPVPDPVAIRIQATFNDIYNKSQLDKFRNGLTLDSGGIVGTDVYDVTIVVMLRGQTISKKFKYVIYSPKGGTKPPKGMMPIDPGYAGPQMIEDVILHFLKSMQDDKYFVESVIPHISQLLWPTLTRYFVSSWPARG